MPTPDAQRKAAELQRQLASLTGHDQATVRPCGEHLLIQMNRDDTVYTSARVTEVGRATSIRPCFATAQAAV
jgi:hypothetical protein